MGATAISLGKTRDDLDVDDLPVLEANIRKLLEPVAPHATIEAIILDLERGVR